MTAPSRSSSTPSRSKACSPPAVAWRYCIGEEDRMSHHLSGLGLSETSMDARTHITDLYAFQKPGDAGKTIFILDVNPESPITEEAVDHESVYEIDVDTDGDAV